MASSTSNAMSSLDILRFCERGSYRTVMSEILLELSENVDTDVLDAIKIPLMLEYPLHSQKIVNEETGMNDLYHLILEKNKGDFKELTLCIIKLVQEQVKDLNMALKQKLRNFTQRITREEGELHLGEKLTILGREKETSDLYNDIMAEAGSIKLINVCGISGIGKSYLVKHVASMLYNEGVFHVIYVNARGISSVADLLTKTLLRLQLAGTAVPSEAEVFGTLLQYLETNSRESFILVFNDLSNMMANEERSTEMLLVLKRILCFTKELKIKIKIVVTSSGSLVPDFYKMPEVVTELTACAAEFRVEKLCVDHSYNVLDLYPLQLGDREKLELVRAADGHPQTLHMLGVLASVDFELTSKIISSGDGELIPRLLFEAFKRLSTCQRKVLLAVGMFNGDASLEAVCKIAHQVEGAAGDQQISKWCDQVGLDFNKAFWLTYRTSDVKVENLQKTVVAPYHPLIAQFLQNMIKSFEEGDKEMKDIIHAIKESFIHYHLEILISVGSKCQTFPRNSCEVLLKAKPDLRKAMVLISESDDPPALLFGKRQQSSGVRGGLKSEAEIVNIFVCLHEYYQCFDGCLLGLMKCMVKRVSSTKDGRLKVLFYTLYVLILAIENKWTTLENVFLQMQADKNTPERIKTQKSLFYFCEAIYCYAQGRLQTFLKKQSTELFAKAQKAIKKFETASSESSVRAFDTLELCRKYFTVHIFLAEACSVFSINPDTVATACEAVKLCLKAVKNAHKVASLKPRIYAELATYKFEESERSDVKAAVAAYKSAFSYYKLAMTGFKDMDMAHSNIIAETMLSLSQSLLGRVRFLDARQQVNSGIPVELKEKLERAIEECEAANRIIKRNCVHSRSAEGLLRVHELLGSCYFTFADFYCRSKDPVREGEARTLAYRNYRRAYNLIHRQPDSCNLPKNIRLVERMLNHLPALCPRPGHQLPQDALEKIIKNLTMMHVEASEDRVRSRKLSGSSIASSSDGAGQETYADPVQPADEEHGSRKRQRVD